MARAQAVEVLAPSGVFQAMSLADQQSIYLALVEEEAERERVRRGLTRGQLARPMATDSGKEMGYKGYDPGFEGSTQAFNELVDSVDFPKFVADLLKAVFDANLKVMKQQTDAYIKLMKEATKSTADFIKKVKDDETFAKLAESKSDQYNVITEQAPDGTHEARADRPGGRRGRPRGRRGQAAHPRGQDQDGQGAPRRAARGAADGRHAPRRQQGPDRGRRRVQVKANRESTASTRTRTSTWPRSHWTTAASPGCFGGPSGSLDVTNTNIQVNTSDKKATDDLSATLKGKVKIEFKTDYFKLDNFANMYADGGIKALAPGGQPAAARRRPRPARNTGAQQWHSHSSGHSMRSGTP